MNDLRFADLRKSILLDSNEKVKRIILVVDDDSANLSLAQALLETEGFAVCTATDAISTFDVLKDCDPDVILMDIELPGMDGWELTRRLKHNIATQHIPVIALTAYGKNGDERSVRTTSASPSSSPNQSARAICRRSCANTCAPRRPLRSDFDNGARADGRRSRRHVPRQDREEGAAGTRRLRCRP